MVRYVINRILLLIPVILAVTIIIFTIMYFVPGDPATVIGGAEASEQTLEAIRDRLGLNDPYIVRLGTYLRDVFLHFDFGESYITGIDISEELFIRLPRTLGLGFATWVLGVVIGIPLGMAAGIRQNSAIDTTCMIVALFGVSMPTFWLGLLLVLFFSLYLGWLPASGIGSWTCYILPAIAGCFGGLASNARQTRSATLEVIRSDYVVTARAKGIPKMKIYFKHVLPNALFPVITSASMGLAHIFGGSVVIEKVFGIPGVGLYMLTGVNNRDYPVVQACVIFLSITFSVVMILVDVLFAFIDPRIKAKYSKGKAREEEDE